MKYSLEEDLRKPCLPENRPGQHPQGSWISQSLSYNELGRLTGRLPSEHFRFVLKTSHFDISVRVDLWEADTDLLVRFRGAS